MAHVHIKEPLLDTILIMTDTLNNTRSNDTTLGEASFSRIGIQFNHELSIRGHLNREY